MVTTASDEKGRETVYDLLPKIILGRACAAVDKASEGLLLLTNDSEWGARISRRKRICRTHTQIDQLADEELLRP